MIEADWSRSDFVRNLKGLGIVPDSDVATLAACVASNMCEDDIADAIVRFRYCSHKPVQEIIEIFDGIYLKR